MLAFLPDAPHQFMSGLQPGDLKHWRGHLLNILAWAKLQFMRKMMTYASWLPLWQQHAPGSGEIFNGPTPVLSHTLVLPLPLVMNLHALPHVLHLCCHCQLYCICIAIAKMFPSLVRRARPCTATLTKG
jgi:hypothetical protein